MARCQLGLWQKPTNLIVNKNLTPHDATEQVTSRVIGSAFAQVKKLGLSNRLFLVTLKEGMSEETVNLFCRGAIGFGHTVLRTLPWFQDKKHTLICFTTKDLSGTLSPPTTSHLMPVSLKTS